ncbi:MAG: UDP-N-acetylglucosamine 2-epimerase (non-hydrolyzing) [Dehalococcoidales bacterium]|nr:UDP-N-acetylglucosamine 2-epimerase (non-hydrolyzing) [Dehalococcoidales bacterium]
MKIASIIGTRPQFIKYGALSKELQKAHSDILIHTGQHYDYQMNSVFFEQLGISEPDYNLGVGSGTHDFQVAEMLKGISDIFRAHNPDMIMLYGDTNSTLAGALAAVQLHIKAAHVEAGLRGFDKSTVEEVNRVVADYCSDLLFCPTQTAVLNLRRENITRGVYLTGDVMVDELNLSKEIAEKSYILENLGLTDRQYLLVTVHRSFNTDNRQSLENIVTALKALGEMGENIVFPVHPRTEKILKDFRLYDGLRERCRLLEPQGYFEFLKLMNHAKKILTDSGGVQKEAYILRVPCITFRENTEWVETVEDGWNILVGTDVNKIIKTARSNELSNKYFNYFGTGACKKIAQIIDKEEAALSG